MPSTRKVKFLHSTYGLLVRIRTYEVYIRGHGHAGCYVDGVGGHGMMSIFAGGIRKKKIETERINFFFLSQINMYSIAYQKGWTRVNANATRTGLRGKKVCHCTARHN